MINKETSKDVHYKKEKGTMLLNCWIHSSPLIIAAGEGYQTLTAAGSKLPTPSSESLNMHWTLECSIVLYKDCTC